MSTFRALVGIGLILAIAIPASAASRVKTTVRKTTRTPKSGIMARPSGNGHWSSSHPTTSMGRGSKVLKRR